LTKFVWGAVTVIIIALLAFSAFRAFSAHSMEIKVSEESSSLYNEEAQLDSEFEPAMETTDIDQDNSLPVTPAFRNVLFSAKGGNVHMDGEVYDIYSLKGMQGIPVAIYCDGLQISGNIQTDSEGYFDMTSVIDCKVGSHAWAQAEYNGRIYESYRFPVRKLSMVSGSRPALVGQYSGVPEFSTGTLAIVVIAGSLGIILLRRNG